MTPNDLKMDPQMWGQCRYSVPRHVLLPKLHSLRPHTSGIHPSPFGAALTPQRLSRGRWGGRCRRLKPLCTIGWALASRRRCMYFPPTCTAFVPTPQASIPAHLEPHLRSRSPTRPEAETTETAEGTASVWQRMLLPSHSPMLYLAQHA